MGLEIIVLLVDVSRLKLTLDLAWDTLYDGLEKRTLRSTRPVQDSRLKVLFDIDAEAELLDWMDAQPWDKDEKKSFHQLLEESTDHRGFGAVGIALWQQERQHDTSASRLGAVRFPDPKDAQHGAHFAPASGGAPPGHNLRHYGVLGQQL